ncbi:hypothetical protein EW093_13495 [Thiospirochaeta perfilievii]|uniref:DUF7033 domain-containing protein n=1 Tax=Thiospirochaeta perfilievii TaxID=252967 RepID=A0A5C1QHF6_9SPIO|nr:polysaccharide deacetylase family protein [Thiospirochaeta perfilievii]QEN05682.1 hypothetical protein EW093_13495 [Thiospirochaeta perfilievii]
MIRVEGPDNNRVQREYICHVLFNEILGIEYTFTPSNKDSWTIGFDNGLIIIPDLLKDKYNKEDIPKVVNFYELPFTPEKDIPGIFTHGEYNRSGNVVTLPIDIFSSSFFMLSRWEESVLSDLAPNGRFSATDSLSYKNNFLDRPVVNEYITWIWNILVELGYSSIKEEKNWELVTTHDIDMIRFHRVKRYLGDIVKHASIKRFLGRLMLLGSNPWDSFDWIMDLSERAGIKSHFYLLVGGKDRMDRDFNLKDPLIRNIIDKIKRRGHIVGIHPSYSSAIEKKQWLLELDKAKTFTNCNIVEGRQHYLRWLPKSTLTMWEEGNMELDSTLGYHNAPGYRCGTGNIFTLFNLEKNRPSTVKERPLIFMDGTFRDYLKVTPEKSLDYFKLFKEKSVKYSMPLTILFHNSSFDRLTWAGWDSLYTSILNLSGGKK